MMAARKMVIVLLIGMVCVSAGFGEVAGKQADPFVNTSVLVEAFIVRVSTEALAEMGVSPIGQAPDGVKKIIEAMAEPDGAEMVAATKVLVCNKHESRVQNSNRVTITRKSDSAVNHEQYQSGLSLNVTPYITAEKTVKLSYSFHASLLEEPEDEAGFPTTYDYEWQSVMTAQSGKPLVAAAAPSEGSVTFLILCATIQDAK